MEKNKFFQYIRGICIILVILIHTLYMTDNSLNNIFNISLRKIVNFAVVVFIFLAGYFTTINKTKDFYKKKVARLIPSLIIWDIIYLLIYILSNENVDFLQVIKGLILSSYGAQLYYIYVLIQLFLIAPLLKKFITKYKNNKIKYFPLLISLIYNFLIFILEYYYEIKVPLYQYWLFGWISYYYLGMLIKEININKKILIPSVIVSLIFSICEGLFIYKSKGLYNLATSQLAIFNFFYSIGICLLLYTKKDNDINSKFKSIIVETGNYSFGIYLSHLLIIKIVKKIFSLVSLNYYINIIVIFSSALIISYYVNKFYYKKGRFLWKKY